MLTPFTVNFSYSFYGIGNTPAVNLLRDTRFPKEDEVSILLLGCGDARNILYTTWRNAGQYDNITFTACDVDPAVLARNIILFANLLTKPGDKDHMKSNWNTYYHFYMTRRDETYLSSITEKLIEASTSLEQWKASSYGTAIQFSNANSMESIRAVWKQYHALTRKTGAQKRAWEVKVIRSQIKALHEKHTKDSTVLSGFRAASPKQLQSLDTMGSIFQDYWTTGVIGGNQDDLADLKSAGNVVNPMLAVSSGPDGDFALHYGTDPVMSFHLATVFDSTDEGDYSRQIVKVAKAQFQKWCEAWAQEAKAGKVRIRIHCGDALAFCHKLQSRPGSRMPIYVSQWKAEELVFDEDLNRLPRKFNVIDTSNLADIVGLLAILPAAVPLLDPHPAAMLYTEFLAPGLWKSSDALTEMLCCEPTSLFVILGVAPVGYLTKVSSDMSGRDNVLLEVLSSDVDPSKMGAKQSLMRIPWKYPASGDNKIVRAGQVHMVPNSEPEMLARLFFNLYQKMFANEDIGSSFSSFSDKFEKSVMSGGRPCYTRASLVLFLALIKGRIRTKWPDFMDSLLHKIAYDSSNRAGGTQMQELICWLHLTGVYDDVFFQQPIRASQIVREFEPFWLRLPIVFHQPTPPHTVYVVLTIPRCNLEVFRSVPMDLVGAPGLHITINYEKLDKAGLFYAISGFFGRLVPIAGDSFHCNIEVDHDGWKGSSDLIVACAVPISSMMYGDPREIQFCVEINISPVTAYYFAPTLGPLLRIFQGGVQDRRVKILNEFPGFKDSVLATSLDLSVLSIEDDDPYTAQLNAAGIVKELSQKSAFAVDSESANLLSKGEDVKAFRDSPCSFAVKVGDHVQDLHFHYPLFGNVRKLRIARSSLWVEVVSAVHFPSQRSGYDPEHFPVIANNDHITQWSLSNVDLGKLSQLSLTQDFSWLSFLFSTSLSAEERSMTKSHSESALLRLKQSIFTMFQAFAGIHPENNGKSVRAFLLVDEAGDSDTVICAQNLLYDPDSASIVMDAKLICLTEDHVKQFASPLLEISREALKIGVLADEEVLWKHLLPALVERCRGYNWEHRVSCPYTSSTTSIPLSTQHGQRPICECGEGETFFEFEYPLMDEYATRIALAPLAAVPYVEEIGLDEGIQRALNADIRKEPDGKMGVSTAAAACDHCGNQPKELKTCVRCHSVRYCNRDCQQAAWKGHKKACEQARRGL